ncbi:UDP-3-O-(3-hydroxymyristoyl)glucosamine N-acyltransferase [Limisalsivibrio acetivorans]|uniref:UDP-3-O-(3-hydroxymyristoyl)glucosamine N-acyltransferase n=1 Tax=Limisalsivibrio acetivorans TaxID=1304888 RepID=UPI0003B3660D|nr:UDP-3-O-(3-hydroxymyristoyl)glucosamine N-acyltransferase [Limisalsivibrio acetivorans]
MERQSVKTTLHLSEIAEAVSGELRGDDITVNSLRSLDDTESGCIAPLFDKKRLEEAESSSAAALLLSASVTYTGGKPAVVVKNSSQALAKLIDLFYPERKFEGGVSAGAYAAPGADIHPSAFLAHGVVVEDGASVGENSYIGANSYIGRGTKIGSGCRIHPGVSVYYGCTVGNNVILHTGAVIGADGFGFWQDGNGVSHKIPQVGGVIIGDDVEIGANTSVDRGALGDTVIGKGTKIDNQVHVGHNTKIGEHCILVGQVGISGSCNIGDRVIFGGRAGSVDHVSIASGTIIAAMGVVDRDVDEPGMYSGFPLVPHSKWLRILMAQKDLPEIKKKLAKISRRVDDGS